MRRTALRRKPRPALDFDREAAELWNRVARSRPCAVCGTPADAGHHVLYQQWLRDAAVRFGRDYERDLRWDLRNLLALCDACHHNHHVAARRVSRAELRRAAPRAFEFARSVGLDWRIETVYPEERND